MADTMAVGVFLSKTIGVSSNTDTPGRPAAIIDYTVTNTGRTQSATAAYLSKFKINR